MQSGYFKSECRKPNSERNPKSEYRELGFLSDFDLRISDLNKNARGDARAFRHLKTVFAYGSSSKTIMSGLRLFP
jgi:hypothetical protein